LNGWQSQKVRLGRHRHRTLQVHIFTRRCASHFSSDAHLVSLPAPYRYGELEPGNRCLALYVKLTYIDDHSWGFPMSRKLKSATRKRDSNREERLGFRLDRQTKGLIERAAQLEGRKITEFCVTALAESARRTIEQHETLALSDQDRKVFFEVLMTPPPASERLERAFAAARRRVRA
jgi:uncharacterized protein (DUF1778 family)